MRAGESSRGVMCLRSLLFAFAVCACGSGSQDTDDGPPEHDPSLDWKGAISQDREIALAGPDAEWRVDVACAADVCGLIHVASEPEPVETAFGHGWRFQVSTRSVIDAPRVKLPGSELGGELYANGQDFLWHWYYPPEPPTGWADSGVQLWKASGEVVASTGDWPPHATYAVSQGSGYVGMDEPDDDIADFGQRSVFRTTALGKTTETKELSRTHAGSCWASRLAQLGDTTLIVNGSGDRHFAQTWIGKKLSQPSSLGKVVGESCLEHTLAAWGDEAALIWVEGEKDGPARVRSLSLAASGKALEGPHTLFSESGAVHRLAAFHDQHAWFLTYAIGGDVMVRRVSRRSAGPALKLASQLRDFDISLAGERLFFMGQIRKVAASADEPFAQTKGSVTARFSRVPPSATDREGTLSPDR